MKKTIVTLACALIAPLAFAQSGTTTTTIVVKTTAAEPISYAIGKTVRFVNRAGHEIKETRIRPGARVHVYYDGAGEARVVNRVVVDDDED